MMTDPLPNEAEARRLAEVALALLELLVPDRAAAALVHERLTAALARPRGQALFALLEALADDPVLRDWTAEQASWGTRWDRFRNRPPAVLRHLTARGPERVPVGGRFSVIAWVTLAGSPPDQSAEFPLEVPPEGRTVTIALDPPDALAAGGDTTVDLRVPRDGDSHPVQFSLTARRPGAYEVTVRAFVQGTFLAEVRVQVTAEHGGALRDGHDHVADLPPLVHEPGEVTLEVSRTHDGYLFQLHGAGPRCEERVRRLAPEPREVRNQIVEELRLLAAGKSEFSTADGQRNRLRQLGIDLWVQAVPAAIRRQFFEHLDDVRSVTVLSATDDVPWELMYALEREHDLGFLGHVLPLVRRVGRAPRTGRLAVRSAAYVLLADAPSNARAEIAEIRSSLGAGVTDRGVHTRLDQLDALLQAPPSVLHVAGHTSFSEDGGSTMYLEQGPFRPVDLAEAGQRAWLEPARPVVFLNACRTADQIVGLTKPVGWANAFLTAGAGAFVGTLWPVRSESAARFATEFYRLLVRERRTFGEALRDSRSEVAAAAADGDPTWLAYTGYGSAVARIEE